VKDQVLTGFTSPSNLVSLPAPVAPAQVTQAQVLVLEEGKGGGISDFQSLDVAQDKFTISSL